LVVAATTLQWGDLKRLCIGEPVMTKAAHSFAPMSALSAASEKSNQRPLDPILLFGGIGLLVFLIAILTGVQGVWY
jgi:hypothetical protein